MPRAMAPFDALYGIEIESASGDEARGAVPVSDAVRQPAGLVHGGVYASMAESLAVAGTQDATGRVAVGHSSQTSFLRPIPGDSGVAHVTARVLRMGRQLVFGEIAITSADEQLAAHATTTYALLGS